MGGNKYSTHMVMSRTQPSKVINTDCKAINVLYYLLVLVKHISGVVFCWKEKEDEATQISYGYVLLNE